MILYSLFVISELDVPLVDYPAFRKLIRNPYLVVTGCAN